MTDDVANLVLRNNYLQTQAISMSEMLSAERLEELARLISDLERAGDSTAIWNFSRTRPKSRTGVPASRALPDPNSRSF